MGDKIMTRIKAIQTYLSVPSKPVTLAELKILTKDKRTELANLCAAELGIVLDK